MALTFYCGSGSPFAWRVWLALEAKQVPYELKMISFSDGDHKKPEFLALNPRHRVPVIVDDGFVLYESAAIVEYLDEQFATGAKLFPGDAKQRARVRRLVREVDDYFTAAGDPLLEAVLFTKRENWNAEHIGSARSKLAHEAAKWEAGLAGDYLEGNAMTAADLALYPQVALSLRMDIRKPDLDVAGIYGPKLHAWKKHVEALPYYEKTIPPHWKQKG
ncbi:MAG TPA: glutathione S-transferase family protein [Burkholderiales bacterium]|nr:glutathione S-transferase family protein [Burkholderiales bacterium]